jgi:hypothetical protein
MGITGVEPRQCKFSLRQPLPQNKREILVVFYSDFQMLHFHPHAGRDGMINWSLLPLQTAYCTRLMLETESQCHSPRMRPLFRVQTRYTYTPCCSADLLNYHAPFHDRSNHHAWDKMFQHRLIGRSVRGLWGKHPCGRALDQIYACNYGANLRLPTEHQWCDRTEKLSEIISRQLAHM